MISPNLSGGLTRPRIPQQNHPGANPGLLSLSDEETAKNKLAAAAALAAVAAVSAQKNRDSSCKMTNFSIAAIMNNSQNNCENDDELSDSHLAIKRRKLAEAMPSLGKNDKK